MVELPAGTVRVACNEQLIETSASLRHHSAPRVRICAPARPLKHNPNARSPGTFGTNHRSPSPPRKGNGLLDGGNRVSLRTPVAHEEKALHEEKPYSTTKGTRRASTFSTHRVHCVIESDRLNDDTYGDRSTPAPTTLLPPTRVVAAAQKCGSS